MNAVILISMTAIRLANVRIYSDPSTAPVRKDIEIPGEVTIIVAVALVRPAMLVTVIIEAIAVFTMVNQFVGECAAPRAATNISRFTVDLHRILYLYAMF